MLTFNPETGAEQDCVVFDIGGTSFRAASYLAAERRICNAVRIPTPNRWVSTNPSMTNIWRELCSMMQQAAREALNGGEPDVVAVAFPGPIDRDGNLLAAPTVWGRTDTGSFPLRERLSALWPRAAVFALNDMTAAGYRYVTPELQDFCLVTVSSGIGNKVFLGGAPVTGPGGRGGEIGHLLVDRASDAVECDCGFRGHLGAVASGRGILATALDLAQQDPDEFSRSRLGKDGGKPSFDTFALAAACRAGDSWAWRAVDRGVACLGHALAAIHTAIGIERFVIIGGFAFALGDEYRRRLVSATRANCWNLGQEWDEMVTFGIDDDDAGLLGAGHYATTVLSAGSSVRPRVPTLLSV
jgi:glucokinase